MFRPSRCHLQGDISDILGNVQIMNMSRTGIGTRHTP